MTQDVWYRADFGMPRAQIEFKPATGSDQDEFTFRSFDASRQGECIFEYQLVQDVVSQHRVIIVGTLHSR